MRGTGGHAGGFWSLVPPEVPATSDDKTKEAQEATARGDAIVVVAMVVASRIPRGN